MGPVRRVGINSVFLRPQMGGIETYVRRLVPSLLEVSPGLELELFVSRAGRQLLAAEPWADDVRLLTHPLLGRRYASALSELTLLGVLAGRQRLDVLHSVAMTGPLRTKPAHVLTIPDVIWLDEPDPAEMNTARLWRLLVPPVARRADRLIAYSQAARADTARGLSIDPARIDVFPLGPGSETLAKPIAPTLNGPIVLSVSALKVHKNLARLVEAMVEVRKLAPTAVLVIPGNRNRHAEELEALADGLGIREGVVLPGWVSPGELEGLYAAAACFAFPSKREGFGLPVLEAMTRAVPVACAAASALPEVAGDAALYFDPESTTEIASAIGRLIEDRALAARLADEGRLRAATFTWRRTAEETLGGYEQAMRARRSAER